MAYHYLESGLQNVWLEDGYILHHTPYGDGVSIHDTEGLHKAIGRWLISLAKPLNGAELRFLRLEMELTQKALASLLGADEQAIRRWEKSRSKAINGPADRLLRALYSEFVDGDGSIRSMVHRLAELNQIKAPIVKFHETTNCGWQWLCEEAA